jgi:hypothetical protein
MMKTEIATARTIAKASTVGVVTTAGVPSPRLEP